MESDSPDEVHDLFKSLNRSKLSRTVRSISVPVSHGGLSFSWGNREGLSEKTKKTEILVYLNDLFNKISPEKGCLSIPYLSSSKFSNDTLESMDRCFNEPVDSKEYHEDFVGIIHLEKVRGRIRKNHHLRDLFLSQNLEDLPPLNFLHCHQIPFKDVSIRSELQTAIDQMFFKRFLDGNETFTFSEFQNEFLDAVKGTQSASTKAVEFLTPIIELDVKPDYLLKVVTGYKSKNFNKELFTSSYNKELKPNKFDKLLLPHCHDFTEEIYSERQSTLEYLACWNDSPPEFATIGWQQIIDTQLESFERPKLEYLYEDPILLSIHDI
jgi:hypothetical protein